MLQMPKLQRLAAERPAPEDVPLPEESAEGDGGGADDEALAPTTDAKENDPPPSEYRAPDKPPAGSLAELGTVEMPTPAPGGGVASAVGPPPPAHVAP